ncbi:MAG: PhoH family protein [Lentisphaeria bacterium]|nr:PhoH family protein [Lentisphaeria bacterium]
MKKIFILDTNVLLHSAAALESFEENIVIIPMPVIEELDKFKKNQDELGRNARRVVRRIDTLREKSAKANGPKLFEGVPMENASGGKEAGTLIVALDVPLENSNLSATDPAYADNRILAIAENILHKAKERDPEAKVSIVSKDLNMRLRADALGLGVEDYRKESIKYDKLFTGVDTLTISNDDMDSFKEGKGITLPKEKELYPNEFLKLSNESNTEKTVGFVRNNRIVKPYPLPDDTVWTISPRSSEQRMALQLLLDPAIQVVTLVGKAGSGKTFLALAAALHAVKKEKLYDRILVTRPIIPMGNDIGYLPGSKDDKMALWMQPVFDNLTVLLRTEKTKDDNAVRRQVTEMQHSGLLALEALTYIRGRSIANEFVIIDEAQNLTPHEVKTILSRAGENTKMILTGDPDQIDNPYLNADTNGLSYAAEHLKKVELHGHITLMKSERSPLAAAIAKYL